MENKLDRIENELKKFNPNLISLKVQNKKLNKPLLLVASKTSKNKIMLFEESMGSNQIAEISYSKNGNSMFISSFEVNENFQQNGLGRFLFDLASAHLDLLGVTKLYGEANPTNNIKGTSSNENVTFEEEQAKIIEIYKKLGCKFPNSDNRFTQEWESGKKIEKADATIESLAYKLAERDGFQKPKQMQ